MTLFDSNYSTEVGGCFAITRQEMKQTDLLIPLLYTNRSLYINKIP